jgi:hypothetical protein
MKIAIFVCVPIGDDKVLYYQRARMVVDVETRETTFRLFEGSKHVACRHEPTAVSETEHELFKSACCFSF